MRAYYRFVWEGEAYLRDGNVHHERQLRILAHYLDGKAYDFYMQKVAPDDPRNWDLHKFFTELYNYCFPIDYKQRTRLKLENLYQGPNQSVAEYIHELQELFSMVGDIPTRFKIIKLWYSLKSKIQKVMWKDGLHPDESTWEEVVAKAEMVKISDSVLDPRERRFVQAGASTSRSSQSNPKNKSGLSSRSVTMTPPNREKQGNYQNNNSCTRDNRQTFKNDQFRRRTDRNNYYTPRGRSFYDRQNQSSRPPPRLTNVNTGTSMTNQNNARFNKNTQLTEKEMADRRASGKCFNCGKEGHMSRNCPERNLLKGGTNKPPGVPSYSMEMSLVEDISDSKEVLESVPLGYLGMKMNHVPINQEPENWQNYYPIWQQPGLSARQWFGDCHVMTIEYQLTIRQPYPGDEQSVVFPCLPMNRFIVLRLENLKNVFKIRDDLVDFEIEITQEKIDNDKFNLGHWYAKKRARLLNLQSPTTEDYPDFGDDPYCLVLLNLLRNGINSHFPNVKPLTESDYRFCVHPTNDENPLCIIYDSDLNLIVEIEKDSLRNPEFELINWYCNHAANEGNFQDQYVINHKHHYCAIPEGYRDLYFDLLESHDDAENKILLNEIHQRLKVKIQFVLDNCQPYPGDNTVLSAVDPTYNENESRFIVEKVKNEYLSVYDRVRGFDSYLLWTIAVWDEFSLGKWYAERCAIEDKEEYPCEIADEWMKSQKWCNTILSGCYLGYWHDASLFEEDENKIDFDNDANDYFYSDSFGETSEFDDLYNDDDSDVSLIEIDDSDINVDNVVLNGVQVDRNKYVSIQRNAAKIKGAAERLLPKPVVLRITINGHHTRALVDSGSLGDFISSTFVDQLHIKRNLFQKSIGLQLAVQGSRSKINAAVKVHLMYLGIIEERHFDVANLNDYDVILGTPWIYQHQVCIGLNPSRIVIGSDVALPITSENDTKPLLNFIMPSDDEIVAAREELMAYAKPLCRKVDETELPPLRAINHTIPLIDENKTYQWRASRCPEIFREQWAIKKDAYLNSGRWKMTLARNTVPMLLIPKPHKPENAQELRTVIYLQERNKNTVKMSSPLLDIEGVLHRVAAKPFRSTLDLTAAYEQIRIVPEHVERSAVTTPDRNMVSLVLQMGDCNGPATYQSLMNHIFSPYLGRFIDVYLDDVMIYSATLDSHLQQCKLAMDILKKEKLYLSEGKLCFLPEKLKLLGRVVDAKGIQMDPEKVDHVLAWKTPTNRDLLRGFIGSVGFLADDIPNIRIPLGILSAITGDTVPFRWGYTEQRAFDDAKQLTNDAREPAPYKL